MRTRARSVGGVLFGQTRSSILSLLYAHPDERFFVRQIARNLSTSVGTVQRELKILEGVGLVTPSRSGNQVFYQARQGSPVYAEIRSLLAKTSGVFHHLQSALQPLARRIKAAFVYGSIARQEQNSSGDIDLMVIGKVSLDRVLESLSTVERSVGRAVNPTVYSPDEYQSKLAGGNHFLTSVMGAEKVFLIGDEDELSELGRVRVAKARTHKSE